MNKSGPNSSEPHHGEIGQKTILVTGFGAFGDICENPSAKIVEILEEKGVGRLGEQYHLVTAILPVDYTLASEQIRRLWKQHKPALVVHMGVHPTSTTVHIERRSFNGGYCRKDIRGKVPSNNVCCLRTERSVAKTALDCDSIAKTVTEWLLKEGDEEKVDVLNVVTSDDPGRYLCAFSYFESLNIDASKSLFVHVPPIDHNITAENETDVILRILKECIRQLNM